VTIVAVEESKEIAVHPTEAESCPSIDEVEPAESEGGLKRTPKSPKPRDTYEAVLIFDEKDDLSDGEGRSKRHTVVESDDDDDFA
ncbi:hypothetical protein BGZ68_002531, partial [Mortierella alpina]